MAGTIVNPETISNPDNTTAPNNIFGKSGEDLVAELHGKYYTSNYRGSLFSMQVGGAGTGVTLPVQAAAPTSVFSLINPVGSTKMVELVAFDWAYVLATTVVDSIGLYWSTAVQTAAATLTTPGTVIPGTLGGTVTAGVALPYISMAPSGTPAPVLVMGYTGAVTSTAANVNTFWFDGRVLVAPGISVHVMMSKAASTAAAFTGSLTWAEHPL